MIRYGFPSSKGFDIYIAAVVAKFFYICAEISAVGFIERCHKPGISRACGSVQKLAKCGDYRILQKIPEDTQGIQFVF